MESKNTLVSWETPCSEVDPYGLDFHTLIYGQGVGDFTFLVKDDTSVYEFKFKAYGPYQINDEMFEPIGGYNLKSGKNTFIVENSSWQKSFVDGVIEFTFGEIPPKHYLIVTSTGCLNILANKEPVITKHSFSEEEKIKRV